MSERSMMVWINGWVMPLEEARISPLDHGVLVGDGVFETLVAREGRPFAARRHWHRLAASCAALDMEPLPYEAYLAAMQAVLEANELKQARVRVTMTSGEGPLGSGRGAGSQTAFVIATGLPSWPAAERVLLAPWPRHENGALAGIKSTSYAGNVRALAYAKARGCGEALLANSRGDLCEGTGSNVFLVDRGKLVTPPLSSGCLAGITRALVLESCHAAGIPCDETPVAADRLAGCDEAFLCSTTRDVQAIAAVDGRGLPAAPGPLTQRVQEAFAAFARGLAED